MAKLNDRTLAALGRLNAKYPAERLVSDEEFNALPPFRRRIGENGELFGKFPTKATHHMDEDKVIVEYANKKMKEAMDTFIAMLREDGIQ